MSVENLIRYALFHLGDGTTPSGASAYTGKPVEFVRDDRGRVTWVRVNGRIARKEDT